VSNLVRIADGLYAKKQTFSLRQGPSIVTYCASKNTISKALGQPRKLLLKTIKKKHLVQVRLKINTARHHEFDESFDDSEPSPEESGSDSDWEFYQDSFKNHQIRTARVSA
jgi:dienelactone hydrolase